MATTRVRTGRALFAVAAIAVAGLLAACTPSGGGGGGGNAESCDNDITKTDVPA